MFFNLYNCISYSHVKYRQVGCFRLVWLGVGVTKLELRSVGISLHWFTFLRSRSNSEAVQRQDSV